MASVDGGGPLRTSIVAQMARLTKRRKRGVADVPRVARPADRPRPDAQWNEAAGRWEVWSKDHGVWVCLEGGAPQAPATRSVDPLEESLIEPPRMDLR